MSLYGEVYFDMLRQPHPISGSSVFMLKRWTKHTIYAQSGSYKHPSSLPWHRVDLPQYNVYSTSSVYLYDYVLVSGEWFMGNVYTSQSVDPTPAAPYNYAGNFSGTSSYYHGENTWLNSPNATTNNYLLRYNPLASTFEGFPVYGYDPKYNPGFVPPNYGPTVDYYQTYVGTPVFTDDGTYFEIIRGYPKNHHIHKRNFLSAERFTSYGLTGDFVIGLTVTSASFRTGLQTNGTTIGPDGLSDGSSPVQSTQVTNIDLVQSDNVIFH